MNPSDSLFLLIKSLTKAEKRHFKLNVSKYETNSGKNYLQLFDAIDAQKIYDEPQIKRKLKNQSYIKRLDNVKTYLYQQILKSLRSFHEDASYSMKLRNYLTDIEILQRKELLKDCLSKIQKAKAFATKYEKFTKLLELISIEATIATRRNDLKKVVSLKKAWIEQQKEAIAQYTEIVEVEDLNLTLNAHNIKQGESRSKTDKDVLKKITSHQLLASPGKSFTAQVNKLGLRYSAMEYDSYEEKLKILTHIHQLFETNSHQIEEQVNAYFAYLLELGWVALHAKDFNTVQRLTHKIKDTYHKKSGRLILKNKIGVLRTEAEFLLCRGEFAAAANLIPAINQVIVENLRELEPVEELFIYHLFFNIAFCNGDYKTAQTYIQKIIYPPSPEIRKDIQSSARILYLVLQYEQQEYEHLGYVIRSTYRFLLKKQILYKPEMFILEFLKKAIDFTSQKQVLTALAELKRKMLPYMNEPFIIDFPLIEWIDSKVHKKNLSEILKENYSKAISGKSNSGSIKMAG